jgi:hypothetical protein
VLAPEPIIEPDISIIDPHHHPWPLPESVTAARAEKGRK